MSVSRRDLLKAAGVLAANGLAPHAIAQVGIAEGTFKDAKSEGAADYTIRIAATPVEIAPKKIISMTTYNGQFPGPLLRFREGESVTVDLQNDTDTPEQLHWHGQLVPVDVDGAAEEGTPYPSARKAAHLVRAAACWISLLPYAQSCRRRPLRRPVQRPGWTRLH